MINRAQFKTRKALFIDECRITDFEWDEGEFFENVAVMLRTSEKLEYMQGKYKQYYDIAGFDTFSGKRLFLFKNIGKPIISAGSMIISKTEGENISKAVYSLNGKCIISFDRYLSIDYIYDHFYVRSNYGYGLCDKYGKEKIEPKYSFAKMMSDYCWYFFNNDDIKGIYFSVNGRCIHPVFKELYYYDEPKILIGVTEKGEKMLYDVKKGKEILSSNIEECCNYYERKYMLTGRY